MATTTRSGGGKGTATAAAFAAVLLHTLTALWVWRSWGAFGRANVLVWTDFPASLIFLAWSDEKFLTASLLLGGLQWGIIGMLLAWLVRRSARRKSP